LQQGRRALSDVSRPKFPKEGRGDGGVPDPLSFPASPPEQVGPDLQPGVNPGTLSFFHERRDHSGSLGSCTLFGTDVRRGNPYDRGNNPYDRADRDRP